jgi:hypothetical protein
VIGFEVRRAPGGELVERAETLDEAIETVRYLVREGHHLPSLVLVALDDDPELDEPRLMGQWGPAELAGLLRDTA